MPGARKEKQEERDSPYHASLSQLQHQSLFRDDPGRRKWGEGQGGRLKPRQGLVSASKNLSAMLGKKGRQLNGSSKDSSLTLKSSVNITVRAMLH